MTESELILYKDFAVDLSLKAGELLMDNFEKMHRLEWKLRTNFKTEVDDLSDNLIREAIIKRFPSHNILSEENIDRDMGSKLNWVVDPLDGTLLYTSGINDHFSVCLSLAEGLNPVLGVIYAPKRNDLYVAFAKGGASKNNEPIQVAQNIDLNRTLMGIDFGKLNRTGDIKYLERLLSPDGITCNFSSGCASVPLALTAEGKMHAYMATSLEPWDMAAAVVIIREAGGIVTNLRNEQWTISDESILASNPILHNNLVQFLGI
ncbi:inositol monophosphatase [Candidatus Daviesbacteria bacterium]|nr:inositol monophosphatase [Candidatus Daviesbacteria bacterium]